MIKLEFPPPDFRMKTEGGKRMIYDAYRKIWVLLTEEEWVRQCFLQLLVNSFHYPASLIAVEKEMILNGRKKRFDILVYSTMHQPWMLVECKAPEVEMNEKVLRQALVYHQAVPVQYIFITNGNTTLGWEKRKGHLELVWQVPEWRKS